MAHRDDTGRGHDAGRGNDVGGGRTPSISGLDDPHGAQWAWRRFRRILGAVTMVGVVAAVVAVWLLGKAYGTLGWIATAATIGGVVGSVAMAGALMGLAFMSSGTGHDEAVDTFDATP